MANLKCPTDLRFSTPFSPFNPFCSGLRRFRVAPVALLLAVGVGWSAPTASAQAVNFGSVNVCPSGATTPAPCSGTGINLSSGDSFNAFITYDGTNLTMTLTDTGTNASWSESWPIDIPSTVGGDTAYVGFTGSTGGYTSTEEILNWTYVQGPS